MKKLFYILLPVLSITILGIVFYVKWNANITDKDNSLNKDYGYKSDTSYTSAKEEDNNHRANIEERGMMRGQNYNKCKQPPGWYIQYLLSNHNKFKYNLDINDENMTIKWRITGNDSDLRLLAEHIECIGEVMESGGTPRRWDPIFVLEVKLKQDNLVKTVVEYSEQENAVYVTKTTSDACAYEVIKAHALVVKGFFETGRQEASKTHQLTDKIKALCQRYL